MVAPIRNRTRDIVYDIPKCKLHKNLLFNYYFICNDKWVPLVEKNKVGEVSERILVFTNREQATQFALECDAIQNFLIVGMTDETWKIFKENEKYVIISEPPEDK